MDVNVCCMVVDVFQIWQWDDYEVVNNYLDVKDLSDDKCYIEKNVLLLVVWVIKVFNEFVLMCCMVDVEFEWVYCCLL